MYLEIEEQTGVVPKYYKDFSSVWKVDGKQVFHSKEGRTISRGGKADRLTGQRPETRRWRKGLKDVWIPGRQGRGQRNQCRGCLLYNQPQSHPMMSEIEQLQKSRNQTIRQYYANRIFQTKNLLRSHLVLQLIHQGMNCWRFTCVQMNSHACEEKLIITLLHVVNHI